MDSPNTSYEPPIHDASQNTPPLPLNQENDSHFSDQTLYQSPIFSSPQQSSKKILSPFSNDGNISSPLNSSINTSYGSTSADDTMNLSYTEIQTNVNSPIKTVILHIVFVLYFSIQTNLNRNYNSFNRLY